MQSHDLGSNVVIVRLKSHGLRFEVACWRDRLAAFHAAVAKVSVDEASSSTLVDVGPIVADHGAIFANAHKNEKASRTTLRKVFGDIPLPQMFARIVTLGDIVEDESERQRRRERGEEAVARCRALAAGMLISRFTGVAPETAELNAVIAEVLRTYVLPPMALSSADVGRKLCDPYLVAAYVASQCCTELRADEWYRHPDRVEVVALASDASAWDAFLAAFDGLVVCRERTFSTVGDAAQAPALQSIAPAGAPPPAPTASVGPSKSEDAKEPSAESAVVPAAVATLRMTLLIDATLLADTAHLTTQTPWARLVKRALRVVVASADDDSRTLQAGEDAAFYTRYGVEDPKALATDAVNVATAAAAHARSEGAPTVPAQAKPPPEQVQPNEASGAAKRRGRHRRSASSSSSNGEGNGDCAPSASDAAAAKYGLMSHKQLQELCYQRGLSHGGKKADLVERLVAADDLPTVKRRTKRRAAT